MVVHRYVKFDGSSSSILLSSFIVGATSTVRSFSMSANDHRTARALLWETIIHSVARTLQSNWFGRSAFLLAAMLMVPCLRRQKIRVRAIWCLRRSMLPNTLNTFVCSQTLCGSSLCTRMTTDLTSSTRAMLGTTIPRTGWGRSAG